MAAGRAGIVVGVAQRELPMGSSLVRERHSASWTRELSGKPPEQDQAESFEQDEGSGQSNPEPDGNPPSIVESGGQQDDHQGKGHGVEENGPGYGLAISLGFSLNSSFSLRGDVVRAGSFGVCHAGPLLGSVLPIFGTCVGPEPRQQCRGCLKDLASPCFRPLSTLKGLLLLQGF